MKDYYLTPNGHFLAALLGKEQAKFRWDDNVRFVLDQHTELYFLQWQLSEAMVYGQKCHSTRTHYSNSEPFKSLFSLLNYVCLAEKQDILIFQSLVLLIRFSVPRSTALDAITVDLKQTDTNRANIQIVSIIPSITGYKNMNY